MVGGRIWVFIGCALVAGACGDDVAAASGAGGGTGNTGADPSTSSDHAADGTGETGENGADCKADADCVNDDPCLAGECVGGSCRYEPALIGECRPAIEVEYPARGATLKGELGEVVTVVGNVRAGAGDIESLTLNGSNVELDRAGGFAIEIDPVVGGNTLVFEAVDSNAWTRRRVQSFLWSTQYLRPTKPMEGAVEQGLLMHLGQESIDALGTVFQLALDSIDIAGVVDPTTPIGSQVGYDIYVTSLTKGPSSVNLPATDRGMHLDAALGNIQGGLAFECTGLMCQLAGGSSTGGLSLDSVDVHADVWLSVTPTNEIQVDLVNVSTAVNNLDIWSNNGWTNALLSLLEGMIINGVVSDLEDALTDQISNTLGPLLADGLSGFSIGAPIGFPSLTDPAREITVQLETDVGETDFHDGIAPPRPSPRQGGLIALRGGGYVVERTVPYDNRGIPARVGCGTDHELISVPRVAPLEIGLADDLLNQLLYGAWAGGLLEFGRPLDSSGGGIQVESVELSGMLAPTANDCNEEGALLAHIGDLQITAAVEINGTRTDFVAYTSLALEIEVGADEKGISIDIPGVAWMETELTVVQDESIPNETGFRTILETMVEQQLIGGLSGGFGGIALPEIDLSGIAGLPPGSTLLTINIDSAERRPGVSVLNGRFGGPSRR